MAQSTTPPAPPSGGGAKYAIIGLVLIGAAVAVYFGMDSCGPDEVVQALPDAGPPLRSSALQEAELVIPDPEPDAGPGEDAGPQRTKVVYRYVRSNWECSGDIPAAAASTVVRNNRRQVRNCYERALKRNHNLRGTLNLHLRVGNGGAVTGVQVGGSLRDPEVFSCVRNLANRWQFPSPSGGSCAVIAQSFPMTPQE